MAHPAIWPDKPPVNGLFCCQIITRDRVRKYDRDTNIYDHDCTLSVETGQAGKVIRVFAAVGYACID